MRTAYPRIPYGWTNFETMRRERMPYVDKTRLCANWKRYATLRT